LFNEVIGYLLSTFLLSTSPQVTELVFHLGKGKDLVATSDYSDFPEAAKQLPRIGPPFAFGVETIARFSPDWVLSEPHAAPSSMDRGLKALRAKHLSLPVRTVDELFTQSERFFETIYPREKNELPARPILPKDPEGFSFLAFTWLNPPILFGHPTFLSDLATRLGGKNALPAGWSSPYPRVSLEWLIQQKVSRIYFLADDEATRKKGKELAAQWWPGQKVETIPLSGDRFGRAGFTALRNVKDMLP